MRKLTYEEIQKQRLTEAEASESHKRLPVIAILEDVRSLYNVGSMFRTSDGAHLEAVWTVGYTPHPPRKEIEKTALGATRTVPTRHFATITEAIDAARREASPLNPLSVLGEGTSIHGEGAMLGERATMRKIAALEITSNSRSVFDIAAEDFPLAIIVGNEITGVSAGAISLCDFTLEIPMHGAKHSLNVAVAYGIAVFECVRAVAES